VAIEKSGVEGRGEKQKLDNVAAPTSKEDYVMYSILKVGPLPVGPAINAEWKEGAFE